MIYKVYINKDSKPVIRRIDENNFFLNSAGSRFVVFTLLLATGLLLGMNSPDFFSTLQVSSPGQIRNGMITGNPFTFDALSRPDRSLPDTKIDYRLAHKLIVPEERIARETSPINVTAPSGQVNEPGKDWETLAVRGGDNLSAIFDRFHISRQDLDKIMALGEPASALKHLMPGHELRLHHADGQLHNLEYDINLTDTIVVSRQDAVFLIKTIITPLETRVNQASGLITDSLFLSAQRAGLADNLTMQLVELFGWDIDFALDIREGDRFSIIYEEKFKKGIKVQDGPILVAEFVNQNTPFHAIRYKTADGLTSYYDQSGYSVRKAFLRTPVNYSRISSLFSLSRRHPILNKIRAHKGVDYAAPAGTPVKATADGIITHVGTHGGYGKMIVLRHGEKYSTAYGHLSKYARNIAAGKRVQQGQTIGYVGRTGLATGPHLHYEFRINGVHHNPLTVDLPKAMGISREEMADFKMHTHSLLAQLEIVKSAWSQQASTKNKTVVALIKPPVSIREAE